jgi:hypothetical protein
MDGKFSSKNFKSLGKHDDELKTKEATHMATLQRQNHPSWCWQYE